MYTRDKDAKTGDQIGEKELFSGVKGGCEIPSEGFSYDSVNYQSEGM
jgi:hypothetical protein